MTVDTHGTRDPRHPSPGAPSREAWAPVRALSGDLLEFQQDILGFLAGQAERQGPVAEFRLGPLQAISISSSDAVKEVLVSRARDFSKGDVQRRAMEPVLRKGLLITEGETHRVQRKLIAPWFSSRSVDDYVELLGTTARSHADRLVHGERVDLLEVMGSITRDVIRSMLWTESSMDGDGLADAVTGAFEWEMHKLSTTVTAPTWMPTARNRAMRRDVGRMRAAVLEIIEDRWGDPDRHPDVLAKFLKAISDGHDMDRDHLVDELVALWGAAHETSADAQFWTAYLLSRHPDVRRRVEAEADEVLGDEIPTTETLPRLTWASAVFREAMRLFPPASVLMRAAEADTEVGGRSVKKGTLVFLDLYSLHRDAEVYPEPDVFRPERFLEDGGTSRAHRFSYLPFGAGPHVCIGSTLALTEGAVFTAVLAARLRLDLDVDRAVHPQLLINLRPRGDVHALVTRRTPEEKGKTT